MKLDIKGLNLNMFFFSLICSIVQLSLVDIQETLPMDKPMAASSTSMTSSTSPAIKVTSSVGMLALSAESTDSGATPYLPAKVTFSSFKQHY